MFRSVVYHGNCLLGEAEIFPQNPNNATMNTWNKEIRISHFSTPSDRCPPLAVLHTIATSGVFFRMESKSPDDSPSSPLFLLHATCLRENKTAIILLGEMEIHLVPMASRKNFKNYSCFWGFNIMSGLYNSCLTLLNLRCLGIVFDLDETLIVANTMRSFEDRIDALQRKINSESDPQRVAGMLADVKRYQDDKSILKQYVDNDQVVENGKVFKAQSEVVPPLSAGQQPIIRPLIRLQEKNIILTRINPMIRDTSVLVRLRPTWEELGSYLTARGRKRFEVYVCTMAERDYAFEMWRLLDPEFNLINTSQFPDRIVCVKSGLRKSLANVFKNVMCHPRMALVIDDRLKVWDDKDQTRVHVVPAFAPYYAPLAETNGDVPVLRVARNVACNVRASFFKDFDEALLPCISEVYYEDDMMDFLSTPDVGNYIMAEDDSTSNSNKDSLCIEGITNAEVERRLKDANTAQAFPLVMNKFDPRLVPCFPQATASSSSMVSQTVPMSVMPLQNNQYNQVAASIKPIGHSVLQEPSVQSSPAREEGEVPESELDPDTRRRLLILQHGQDVRDNTAADPSLPVRPPVPPPIQPQGNWFSMDEDVSPSQMIRRPKEYPLDLESILYDKKRSNHTPFFQGMENSSHADRGFQVNQRFSKKKYRGGRRFGVNHSAPVNYESFPGEEMSGHLPPNYRDALLEPRRVSTQYAETPFRVLEEIASKCRAKVEFRMTLIDTTELQFSTEVMFVGEKVGEGIGKTRKEAQHHAAEHSLRTLSLKYLSDAASEPNDMHEDLNKYPHSIENGFVSDMTSFGYPTNHKSDILPVVTLEQSQILGCRLPSNKSLSALNELCTQEGFDLVFQPHPSLSADMHNEGELHVQAEIDGKVLGKGIGMTWEEAKLQASEEALANLKSSLPQFAQKHVPFPRSFQTAPNKRQKADFSRSFPRTNSSRFSKNETFVP